MKDSAELCLGSRLKREKTLILYSYFENEQYFENLSFFLKHGTSAPDTDYVIIANGKISIDCPPNIKLIKRNNIGFDFGAWTHGLSLINTAQYDYFIFINSTVRGPFLPCWAEKQNWVKAFTKKINDETKLVGTTVNCYNGLPHVQSMLLATDQLGLEIAKKTGIFNNENCSKEEAQGKEIGFSGVIMDAGYNIGCMLLSYEGVDFRKDPCKCANKRWNGDPWFENLYFGINVNPFEVLFFKTNRNVNSELLKRYTDWTNNK